MASFTVRIVLHEADSKKYQELHEAMVQSHSAAREIRAGDTSYDLPDGEYIITSGLNAKDLCAAVLKTATSVKATPSPSVLVTEAKARSFFLRKVPGDS